MANAEQVKALIRSHAEGDDARFYSVALQVAAQAARSGHGRLAQDLRDAVDQAKAKANSPDNVLSRRVTPLAQPRGELAGLMSVSYPKLRLSDLALDDQLRHRLERVVREQRQRKRIRMHGYSPMRKVLLVGPPGTGKSMTASAFAGELGIPLFTVQLDGLVTRFLGETAAKLRLVFDALQSTHGVYLFDEFDSLGSERGSGNDVGEIRRVLNSFLQFLEIDDSDSLVVAATNHVRSLDQALFRRFDAVIEYTSPSPAVALQVMRNRLGTMKCDKVDWAAAVSESEGLSHSEIAQACDQAAKDAILAHTTIIQADALIDALRERRRARSKPS
jgi:SpoVK/Ycf46/Vps4 family AAA+-type ATPase